MPVAGVASRQGAQRQQPRHETKLRLRFAGRDKLVYLIEAGEASPRRNTTGVERVQRREPRIQRQSGMAKAGWEPQADTPASAVP